MPLTGAETNDAIQQIVMRVVEAVGMRSEGVMLEYCMRLPKSGLILVRFATIAIWRLFFYKYIGMKTKLTPLHLAIKERTGSTRWTI